MNAWFKTRKAKDFSSWDISTSDGWKIHQALQILLARCKTRTCKTPQVPDAKVLQAH
jgi:hypothetical protein